MAPSFTPHLPPQDFDRIVADHQGLMAKLHAVEKWLDALAAVQGSDDMTKEGIEALERVVVTLEPLLDAHFVREEASALYTSLPGARPDLVPTLTRLRGEHATIRSTLLALLGSISSANLAGGAAEIIDQGWDLVRILRRHEHEEHELLGH